MEKGSVYRTNRHYRNNNQEKNGKEKKKRKSDALLNKTAKLSLNLGITVETASALEALHFTLTISSRKRRCDFIISLIRVNSIS